jgi:hypothetical protein
MTTYSRTWKQQQRIDRDQTWIRIAYWILTTALLIAAAVVVLAAPARAEESLPATFSPARSEDLNAWTKTDTALQAIVLAELAVDRAQTREAQTRRQPELGWARTFIGTHPSHTQTDTYFAACALLHTAIAVALPKPYRTIWQGVWIGIEHEAISTNTNVGISMRF